MEVNMKVRLEVKQRFFRFFNVAVFSVFFRFLCFFDLKQLYFYAFYVTVICSMDCLSLS